MVTAKVLNRSLVETVLEIVAYGVVAAINVHLVVSPDRWLAVWFPAGILVAGLLRRNVRHWVPFALLCTFAAVPADLSMGRAPIDSVILNLADTIGFCLMAMLIRRFVGPSLNLLRFRDAYTFAWTVVVGAMVSGVTAACGFALLGHPEEFWPLTRTMTTSVTISCWAVVPAILGLRRRRVGDLFGNNPVEGIGLFIVALGTTALVFFMPATRAGLALSLLYLPVIAVGAFALRRGVAETSILNALFVTIACTSFYFRTGPASSLELSSTDRLLWIDAFIGFVVLAVILMGAMNEERRRAVHRLTLDRNRTLRRVDERTNELQRAVSDLETFAYSVSHDLRAPLRGMALHVELLQDEFGSRISPAAQESVLAMRERIDRMNRIITGLLRLAKAQRKGLHLTRVNVKSVVQEILLRHTSSRDEENLRISIYDLPECYADLDLVRQVFENLLSNALKYGSLAREPHIEVSGRFIDGGVVYSVKDNGPGFDPSMADSVFDVFQRGTGKARQDSEGVGLAIVKHIASRHGGRASAETSPGHGATFSVWFPRAAAPITGAPVGAGLDNE